MPSGEEDGGVAAQPAVLVGEHLLDQAAQGLGGVVPGRQRADDGVAQALFAEEAAVGGAGFRDPIAGEEDALPGL